MFEESNFQLMIHPRIVNAGEAFADFEEKGWRSVDLNNITDVLAHPPEGLRWSTDIGDDFEGETWWNGEHEYSFHLNLINLLRRVYSEN